jgi:hypothetical protein
VSPPKNALLWELIYSAFATVPMTPGHINQHSTSEVAAGPFRPHGHIDVWLEDDMVYYEATGPFNVELINALAATQKNFFETLTPPQAWASIGVLLGSVMMGLDALARYKEVLAAPKPAAYIPRATAFVIGPDVEGGFIIAPHFRRIFCELQRPMQIFPTASEAVEWVHDVMKAQPQQA